MATPTLKRSWSFAGLSGAATDTGNNFKINLEPSGSPAAVTAGDLVLVSVGFHSAVTATISDDQSNTWTSATSTTNGTLNFPRKWQIFWAISTAGMSTITVGFGGLTTDIQIAVSLWYNTASSSPIDVTAGGSNISGATIASGSMTTTVDGDLIYHIAWDENSTGNGGQLGTNPQNFTGITFGSGFTGLFTETDYGQFAQYQVQSTHGAINPSMTISQTTTDTFGTLAIAIKPGTSGSAPGNGIRIVHSQMIYTEGQTSVARKSWFPSSGNLLVLTKDTGEGAAGGIPITSITDSNSNSWSNVNNFDGAGSQWAATNATTGNGLVVTINIGANTNANTGLWMLCDITGAATSPIDTAVAAKNTSSLVGNNAVQNILTENSTSMADLPSLAPSTSNGMIIVGGGIGNGPASAVSPGTYDYVAATWNAGGGDSNGFVNGDLMAHKFYSSTATVNFTWTVINNTSQIGALAVAFKAASTAAFEDDSISKMIFWPVEPVVSVW